MKQETVTIKKEESYLTNDYGEVVKLSYKGGCVHLSGKKLDQLLEKLGKETLVGMEAIVKNNCEDCRAREHFQCIQEITVDGQTVSTLYICYVADM